MTMPSAPAQIGPTQYCMLPDRSTQHHLPLVQEHPAQPKNTQHNTTVPASKPDRHYLPEVQVGLPYLHHKWAQLQNPLPLVQVSLT